MHIKKTVIFAMSNSDRRFGTYVQPCEEAWYIKELKTPPPSLAARLVTSIRTVVKQTDTTKSLCNAGHLFIVPVRTRCTCRA